MHWVLLIKITFQPVLWHFQLYKWQADTKIKMFQYQLINILYQSRISSSSTAVVRLLLDMWNTTSAIKQHKPLWNGKEIEEWPSLERINGRLSEVTSSQAAWVLNRIALLINYLSFENHVGRATFICMDIRLLPPSKNGNSAVAYCMWKSEYFIVFWDWRHCRNNWFKKYGRFTFESKNQFQSHTENVWEHCERRDERSDYSESHIESAHKIRVFCLCNRIILHIVSETIRKQ